ncbi:MAG: hypothetical protein RL094_79 [Candidatus Parcubacteria bacterium]|jgi:restriction endonuclease S subunit
MKNNQLQKDIPSGWTQVTLADVSHISSGGTPDTNNKDFWDGEINWITPTEITKTGKYITLKTEKKITELGLKNSSARLLPKGSLIVCTRATVGECSISTYPISTNQGFKNLIPKKDTTVDYLFYFIKSIKPTLMKLGSGSTFLEVSKGDFEKIKLNFPPLSEQNRIVSVLETWDKLIEKITEKIKVKKNVKKGLMQDLLTGNKRLKGFEDKWEFKVLGEICEIKRGGSPRPIQDYITENKDGLNWLRIGDVPIGDRFIYKTTEKIKKEGLNKTTLVKEGDFILSNSMSFGRPYIMKINACIHDGWLALMDISSSVNKDFLYYLLSSSRIQSVFRSISAGSGVQNLKKETVSEVVIHIPKIKEQTAIANILTATDNEIDSLEKKLSIFKEQKRYLLNNLITGKIRTPETLSTKLTK